MIRIFLVIFSILSLSACSKTTLLRAAPDYKAKLTQGRSVLLLPPIVEVNQVDISYKKTRMYNHEDYIEGVIIETLQDKLRDKGYSVRLFSRTEIADNKLSHSFINSKDDFADTMHKFYKDGAWKEEHAYVIKQNMPAVTDIGRKSGADLIVMLNFSANVKTSGAAMLHFLVAPGYRHLHKGIVYVNNVDNNKPEISKLKLAIIDASTGRVLWAHSASGSRDIVDITLNNLSKDPKAKNQKIDRKNIASLIDQIFKDLPSR